MIVRKLGLAALMTLCVAVLSACASGAALSPAPSGEPVAVERVTEAYRLGLGDRIRVITFGEAALSGEFEVGGGGVVAFPLIGNIQAAGLTAPELQARLVGVLKEGYLKDPRVSVEMLTYRPFYILGEVNKPGEYPYTNGLTVLNAVATAEGFTYRADSRRVFIKRANDNEEKQYQLSSSTPVAPGDTIRITERYF